MNALDLKSNRLKAPFENNFDNFFVNLIIYLHFFKWSLKPNAENKIYNELVLLFKNLDMGDVEKLIEALRLNESDFNEDEIRANSWKILANPAIKTEIDNLYEEGLNFQKKQNEERMKKELRDAIDRLFFIDCFFMTISLVKRRNGFDREKLKTL